MTKVTKIVSLIILNCFLYTVQIIGQISFSEYGYEKIDSVLGSVLYSKTVKKGNLNYKVYCQLIDIKHIKVSNFIEQTDEREGSEGKYIMQKELSKSPYFKSYLYDEVLKKFKKNTKSKPIGMINGVFFEEFGSVTQLAFPIKHNGKILSAGSSSNGPCENPKNPVFKNIKLKALVWSDSVVAIKDYDVQTGMPLTDDEFSNGLVSYSCNDHPARLFRPTLADKFLVIGTLNDGKTKYDNKLVILTVNSTRIEFAEAHLRQLGVSSPVITIGGSASAFIFNQNKGLVESPGMVVNDGNVQPIKLPHFIIMTPK